ncbi:dynein regulatory complex subunit 3-like [Teleopsis dalmanni]|uniref:dynein regulatory complex subunit 3-like n=1 Tax=Teleopsis dalmanni TaxID=139649 RepID=UPI0018CD1279|nr:dynein regulatory complex subunit 3-like [Teleopsis dalmanni]XP_037955334.1 dynein regulatory complex subunit 3-like [Teleopsis dalmanni]
MLAQKKDPVDVVIFPQYEPLVINQKVISDAYLNVFVGEKQRLHNLEEIRFEDIHTLRMEFKNILRIRQFEILPNLTTLVLSGNNIENIECLEKVTSLKELDLSFNKIERIENLDTLVNLKRLLLAHNLIPKIENLDNLVELKILSLSYNKIKTIDGLDRLRFSKNFKAISLEGNPIASNPDIDLKYYTITILPNLEYYDFQYITIKDRQLGLEKYIYRLRAIEAEQEDEVKQRYEAEKEISDAEKLMGAFVEHLNGHQLFRSLWENDEDGRILLSIGDAADEIVTEYDEKMFELTQKIYKHGLEKYHERCLEEEEFAVCMEECQTNFQNEGQSITEKFATYTDQALEQCAPLLKRIEKFLLMGGDEESPEYATMYFYVGDVMDEFDMKADSVWTKLMNIEIHLHEVIEETIVIYGRNLYDLISMFVEHVQSYFSQLRDVVQIFVNNLQDEVSEYLINTIGTEEYEDVLPELKHCMEDRDALDNLLAGMKDAHTGRIDEREDRLITRSREYVEHLIEDLQQKEQGRHSRKILEINDFVAYTVDRWDAYRDEIRKDLLHHGDNI